MKSSFVFAFSVWFRESDKEFSESLLEFHQRFGRGWIILQFDSPLSFCFLAANCIVRAKVYGQLFEFSMRLAKDTQMVLSVDSSCQVVLIVCAIYMMKPMSFFPPLCMLLLIYVPIYGFSFLVQIPVSIW